MKGEVGRGCMWREKWNKAVCGGRSGIRLYAEEEVE